MITQRWWWCRIHVYHSFNCMSTVTFNLFVHQSVDPPGAVVPTIPEVQVQTRITNNILLTTAPAKIFLLLIKRHKRPNNQDNSQFRPVCVCVLTRSVRTKKELQLIVAWLKTATGTSYWGGALCTVAGCDYSLGCRSKRPSEPHAHRWNYCNAFTRFPSGTYIADVRNADGRYNELDCPIVGYIT